MQYIGDHVTQLRQGDRRYQELTIGLSIEAVDDAPVLLAPMDHERADIGIEHAGNPPSKLAKVLLFLLRFRIEAFEEDAAAEYGSLRVALKHNPIGPYDLLIAAHACSLGAVLVSKNVSEFRRVPGLRVENWLDDSAPRVS
jgi:PIN domain